MTVSLRDMRRCCRERGLLIVKPFAGGYKFGQYVEHCQHNGGVWATIQYQLILSQSKGNYHDY